MQSNKEKRKACGSGLLVRQYSCINLFGSCVLLGKALLFRPEIRVNFIDLYKNKNIISIQ